MLFSKLFRREDKPDRRDAVALGLISALFAVVSFANITRWSIWFDEAFSAYLMRYNFVDIARYTSTDVHPPLYYWLLKCWTLVFGTSDLALRSFSAVVIFAAIVVTYLLIRELFGRRAAIWTGALLAISPMMVRFSEEARMYGLVLLIVAGATYVLVRATERPTRKKWLIYGLLVSLGMWTHYFTAVVWLSHWVWRWLVRGKFASTKRFFTKDWVHAHVLAVALYLPWLPFMAKQLGTVQGTGFWIRPVTPDSVMNFLTNTFLYLGHAETKDWYALIFVLTCAIAVGTSVYAYRHIDAKQRPWFVLTLTMAVAPVVLLFIASLPPLRPSFIERYLIPSSFWLIVTIAIALSVVTKRLSRRGYIMAEVVILTLILGIGNVYTYGNVNRNATPVEAQSMKQTMQMLAEFDDSSTPIVADSPWRFYEAIHYDTDKHPVYFVAEDDNKYGSYDMLRYSDFRKIKDIDEFGKTHGAIWYVSNWYNDEPRKPRGGKWQLERTVRGPSPLTNGSATRAYKYVYIGD